MSEKLFLIITAIASFLITYVWNIGIAHVELYLATIAVIALDGVGGVIRAVKRRNFMTYRAIRTVKKLWVWALIITTILMIEKGADGLNWLDETIVTPFIVFELISALKNFHQAGLINGSFLKKILENIDSHKD